MEQQLHDLYYDPEKGFNNLNQFWRTVKEYSIKVNYKTVKEWYNKQSVNQVYKPPENKNFDKIIAPFNSVGTLQMDLMVPKHIWL
jgi:hypothetical protein